ncbi:MAG: hypothetical protein KDA79_10020 [Planctomycetaceae bacterium]|nr:hypothetical protein [Planctomycetaceae bacterium]
MSSGTIQVAWFPVLPGGRRIPGTLFRRICRLVLLLMFVPGSSCGLELPAAETAEPVTSGHSRLTQAADGELMVLPAGATVAVPLRTISRLKLPRQAVVSPSRGPMRSFELITGEVLSGELLESGPEFVTARFFGREVRLQRSHIRRIATSGPYADVLVEDFARPNSCWQPVPDASLSVRPAETARTARPPDPHLILPASGLRTTRPLPLPLATGRVALDILQPPFTGSRSAGGRFTGTAPAAVLPEWGIELIFTLRNQQPVPAAAATPSETTRLIIRCGGPSGVYGLELKSEGRPLLQKELLQPLRPRAGPARLTFLLTTRKVIVLLDDLLLAQLKPAAGPQTSLAGITLIREPPAASRPASGPAPAPESPEPDTPAPTADSAAPAVSHLTVQRLLQEDPPARLSWSGTSGVVLGRGTELYGELTFLAETPAHQPGHGEAEVEHAPARFLQLKNASGSVRLGWSQLHSIHWPPDGQKPVAQLPVTGVYSQVVFQPFADLPGTTPDQISAALMGLIERKGRTLVRLHHPLLGRFAVPLRQVREIRPRFSGTAHLLAAGPYHLGESQQPDFLQPEPYGIRLTGGFRLNQQPAGPVFLRIVQTGVEAAGPAAPPGSPFLSELRRGGLVTEVLLNNQLLGTLNAQLRFRSRPGEPRDVRIPVPADVLQTGLNRWQIRQQPDSRNRRSYDDCEIGPVFLELEARPIPANSREPSNATP